MTESNVVALPGFSVPNDAPVEKIVELLEEALGEARNGRLIGLAMVAVTKDPDLFETRFHATQGSRHSLGAGVLSLGWQIGRELSEGE
jgi:hypothetical protein